QCDWSWLSAPRVPKPAPPLNLLLLLLDRLLDRLDEVGVFLVGGQLGGVGFRVFALGVFVGRHALMGVVEYAPDQPLTNHLGGLALFGLAAFRSFQIGTQFLSVRNPAYHEGTPSGRWGIKFGFSEVLNYRCLG